MSQNDKTITRDDHELAFIKKYKKANNKEPSREIKLFWRVGFNAGVSYIYDREGLNK